MNLDPWAEVGSTSFTIYLIPQWAWAKTFSPQLPHPLSIDHNLTSLKAISTVYDKEIKPCGKFCHFISTVDCGSL